MTEDAPARTMAAEMLVLSRDEVEELLDPDALVAALEEAMRDLSSGSASMPSRIAAEAPEGFLAAMPAFLPSSKVLATKLVTVFPHNEGDLPTHQAVIVCFDPETGVPLALMDGTHITEARTAAGSSLATRLLALPDARVLAILGTGAQAAAHVRALARGGRFERVLLAGRTAAKVERLARSLSEELGVEIEPLPGLEEAVRAADVVCACTHSPEPVIRRSWLSAGAHVNSVGFNTAGREVDAETVADAVVVVESRGSALAPPPAGANDLLLPLQEGLVRKDFVHAEIGELVAGKAPGRTSEDQITLYKSVGVAVQDAAAAALVLSAAGSSTRTSVEL